MAAKVTICHERDSPGRTSWEDPIFASPFYNTRPSVEIANRR